MLPPPFGTIAAAAKIGSSLLTSQEDNSASSSSTTPSVFSSVMEKLPLPTTIKQTVPAVVQHVLPSSSTCDTATLLEPQTAPKRRPDDLSATQNLPIPRKSPNTALQSFSDATSYTPGSPYQAAPVKVELVVELKDEQKKKVIRDVNVSSAPPLTGFSKSQKEKITVPPSQLWAPQRLNKPLSNPQESLQLRLKAKKKIENIRYTKEAIETTVDIINGLISFKSFIVECALESINLATEDSLIDSSNNKDERNRKHSRDHGKVRAKMAAKENNGKYAQLNKYLDSISSIKMKLAALEISDINFRQRGRQTYDKIARMIRFPMTPFDLKEYELSYLTRKSTYESLVQKIVQLYLEIPPKFGLKRAVNKNVTSLTYGLLSNRELKIANFFEDNYTRNVAPVQKQKKNRPDVNKMSTAHITEKLRTTKNRREEEELQTARKQRLGLKKTVTRVRKSDKSELKNKYSSSGGKDFVLSSKNQGLLSWVIRKSGILGEPLEAMKSANSFVYFLVRNSYHEPTPHEIEVAQRTFQITELITEANKLSYLSEKVILNKELAKYFDPAKFTFVHEGKEAHFLVNDYVAPSPNSEHASILTIMMGKIVKFFKAIGSPFDAIAKFIVDIYNMVLKWVRELWVKLQEFGEFCYFALAKMFQHIASWFNINIPSYQSIFEKERQNKNVVEKPDSLDDFKISSLEVTEDSEVPPSGPWIPSDPKLEDSSPIDDPESYVATSSNHGPDESSFFDNLMDLFSNLFGPFAEIVTASKGDASFHRAVSNANGVMRFLYSFGRFMVQCFSCIKDFIQYLISDVPDDSKFVAECEKVLGDYESLIEPSVEQSELVMAYFHRLRARDLSISSRNPFARVYTGLFRRFQKIRQKAEVTLASAHTRREPFSIHIVGAPGMGKTTLAPLLIQMLFRMNSKEAAANTYAWETFSEYQDGFNGQRAIIMNDIFNAKDEQTDKRTVDAILHIVSNDYYPAPAADPQSKGIMPVKPDLFISTGNCITFPAIEALRDPAAYARRRSVVVEMVKADGLNVLNDKGNLYNDYVFIVKNRFDETAQEQWFPMDATSFFRYVYALYQSYEAVKPVLQSEMNTEDLDVSDYAAEFLNSIRTRPVPDMLLLDEQIAAIYKKTILNIGNKIISNEIRSTNAAESMARATSSYDEIDSSGTRRSRRESAKPKAVYIRRTDLEAENLARSFSGKVLYKNCFIASGCNIAMPRNPNDVSLRVADVDIPEDKSLWSNLCVKIVKNWKMLTAIGASLTAAALAIAMIVSMKDMPSYNFSTNQMASGIQTPAKPRMRQIVKRHFDARNQNQAEYINKIGDNIVSLVAYKNGVSRLAFNIVLLDANYFITNVHCMASLQNLVSDLHVDEMKVIVRNGYEPNITRLDFETDTIEVEGTDLCIARFTKDTGAPLKGVKSIIKHFVMNFSDTKVGLWTFNTLRKKASFGITSPLLVRVDNIRTENVPISDDYGKIVDYRTSQLRGDVDSESGFCGSLLLGSQANRIVGLHASGSSSYADFTPLCAREIVDSIRTHFDSNYLFTMTVPVDSIQDTSMVDFEEEVADQTIIHETESPTIFRPRDPQLGDPPSSKPQMSRNQGPPTLSRSYQAGTPSSTPTCTYLLRYAPIPQSWMKRSTTIWWPSLSFGGPNLTFMELHQWMLPWVVSKDQSVQYGLTLEEAGGLIEVNGEPYLEIISCVKTVTPCAPRPCWSRLLIHMNEKGSDQLMCRHALKTNE